MKSNEEWFPASGWGHHFEKSQLYIRFLMDHIQKDTSSIGSLTWLMSPIFFSTRNVLGLISGVKPEILQQFSRKKHIVLLVT